MGPRLVATLKDEDGKVISTPEAAAAMWERKFLQAFSGMGDLRDFVARLHESQDERVAATVENQAVSVVSEVEWLTLLSDALATTRQKKAVGPDAPPTVFLRAGGISLLPHLARLAAQEGSGPFPKQFGAVPRAGRGDDSSTPTMR